MRHQWPPPFPGPVPTPTPVPTLPEVGALALFVVLLGSGAYLVSRRSTKGSRAGDRRLITLIFEEDKLQRVLGDVPDAPGLKTGPAAAASAPVSK